MFAFAAAWSGIRTRELCSASVVEPLAHYFAVNIMHNQMIDGFHSLADERKTYNFVKVLQRLALSTGRAESCYWRIGESCVRLLHSSMMNRGHFEENVLSRG